MELPGSASADDVQTLTETLSMTIDVLPCECGENFSKVMHCEKKKVII